MDNVTKITNYSVKDIQNYLKQCEDPFETSQLYSSTRGSKFINEDLRKSNFRAIIDTKLFDLVEDVVATLNENDSSYNYTLRRNDITHIVYEKGGFFKRHRDYLSTTSNLIEEFTLLLCVTPPDSSTESPSDQDRKSQGGNTTIFTYGGSKSFDTTTAGCGILFRKDLEHEGQELEWGEKHIITANIWATRIEQSKQVLLVTFPSTKSCPDNKTESSTSVMSSIEQAADDNMSYAIPADTVTGMLQTHIEWKNRQAEDQGGDPPPIITYQCLDFDYETFGVIDKIFSRSYIHEDAIERAIECNCLEFFGPFQFENMLVHLALEDKNDDDNDADNDAEGIGSPRKKKARNTYDEKSSSQPTTLTVESDKYFGPPRPPEFPIKNEVAKQRGGLSYTQDTTTLQPKSSDDEFDTDIIVCETEARMRVVSSVARDLGEPYVPFQMLFVEGVLETGGEFGITAVEIPMTVGALLVGDYNNIFALRKISHLKSIEPQTLKQIHSQRNFFEKKPPSTLPNYVNSGPGNVIENPFDPFKIERDNAFMNNPGNYFLTRDDDDDDEQMVQYEKNGIGTSLKVGLGDETSQAQAAVMRLITATHDYNDNLVYHRDEVRAKVVYLPGCGELMDDKDTNDSITNSLFHRDEAGLVTFTSNEADLASEFIASIDLDERVKASLQKKRFTLPQQEATDVDSHFCNETVYGKVNILWVTGVIRMPVNDSLKTESDDDSKHQISTKSEEFDAWPSYEVKSQMYGTRQLIKAHTKHYEERLHVARVEGRLLDDNDLPWETEREKERTKKYNSLVKKYGSERDTL